MTRGRYLVNLKTGSVDAPGEHFRLQGQKYRTVITDSKIQALRRVFAPKGERYVVIPSSYSGHCCFRATVLDLGGDEVQTMCESFILDDAVKIAAALNAGEA